MTKIIHLVERGLRHPYLCNHAVEPTPEKSTFDPMKVTCKNCLKQITQGNGFGHKCNYCTNFKTASNRPDYAWCNSDPLPEEITACRPFLDEQVAIIDPKIIVTLGRFSMEKFLPGEKISQIHGQARFVHFAGKKRIILPVYHPAAALRRGEFMNQLKIDFQKITQFLQNEPPSVSEKPDPDQQMDLF